MAKILVSEYVHPCGPALLQAAGHQVFTLDSRTQEDLAEKLREADGLFVRVMDITAEMLAGAPDLKIISKHGVGVDNIDLEAAKARGIAVTVTPGANSTAVAEHTFALMMTLAKNIIPMSDGYRTKGFEVKNTGDGVEITGKTLGLIGYGRIGSQVAAMGRGGFGMEVVVYDPYITQAPAGVTLVDTVEEVLRRADFVSIHSPLTEQTHHLIDATALGLMKPTAILVNCARGPIIDEQALVRALEQGQIAGAGLDVTEQEPAAPDNPLFSMPNVILTPHYAPCTKETSENVSRIGCENLVAFFAGQEPVGRLV